MDDRERPTRRAGARGLWLGAAALLAFVLVALFAQRPRVVFDGAGDYGRVRVTESRSGLRTLYTGEGRARQSVIRPGDPLHLELAYTRVASIGLALVPPDARILYIGLGGGAMPMHAHHVLPRATIDAVEIDPLIVDVALEHFGFRPDSLLRVHTADGRAFIEAAAPGTWDLIVLDAFSDDAIPHALATREFLEAVHARMKPSGILLSNLWTSSDAYPAMIATYRSVFGDDARLLHVPARSQAVLIAARAPHALTRASLAAAATRLADPALESIIRDGYAALPATDAEVLLDSAEVVLSSGFMSTAQARRTHHGAGPWQDRTPRPPHLRAETDTDQCCVSVSPLTVPSVLCANRIPYTPSVERSRPSCTTSARG